MFVEKRKNDALESDRIRTLLLFLTCESYRIQKHCSIYFYKRANSNEFVFYTRFSDSVFYKKPLCFPSFKYVCFQNIEHNLLTLEL